MSNSQTLQCQDTIIGYCWVCGSPIYGNPGSTQKLCKIHQAEADLIKKLREELKL